jgi:hypothetical protein
MRLFQCIIATLCCALSAAAAGAATTKPHFNTHIHELGTPAMAALHMLSSSNRKAPSEIEALRGGAAVARSKASVATKRSEASPVLVHKRLSVAWPIFSAWLYFLACAFTIPSIPKIVNELVGSAGKVTARSATVYGLLQSTDSFFTFLTTNFHSTLSDTFGRKPFMALR